MVDRVGGKRCFEHRSDLLGVDPAVEELELLPLPREHVMDAQAIEIPILERFELALEDDGLGGAIAVKQHHPAPRLAREHAAEDRHDRRDAGARRDRQIIA